MPRREALGDIYTPAELALLKAVASASGEVLQRLGAGEVAEQARAMQVEHAPLRAGRDRRAARERA